MTNIDLHQSLLPIPHNCTPSIKSLSQILLHLHPRLADQGTTLSTSSSCTAFKFACLSFLHSKPFIQSLDLFITCNLSLQLQPLFASLSLLKPALDSRPPTVGHPLCSSRLFLLKICRSCPAESLVLLRGSQQSLPLPRTCQTPPLRPFPLPLPRGSARPLEHPLQVPITSPTTHLQRRRRGGRGRRS